MTATHWKFGIALGVIVVTLAWLGFTAVRDSASYYVTVTELKQMPDAHTRRLRVAGEVVAGSIHRRSGETDFALQQGAAILPVAYVGADPLPDTFVDHAQAVAAGRLLANGTFQANGVQAKCASKYEPRGVRAGGRSARTTAGTM